MRHSLCLVSMLFLCIGNVFSQSVVDFGSNLSSTKYYESMNAATPPADNWYAVDFDDSNWRSYTNPVEYLEHDAFWVRRTFLVTDNPANHSFQIRIAHDRLARFYVNGHQVHSDWGCGRYYYCDVPSSYLVKGVNVLAVYANDDDGGSQYLECFISATDGSDIIMDLPKQPLLVLPNSELCIYKVDGYSNHVLNAQMVASNGLVDAQISWISSNPEVATVLNGQISAVSAGIATITASAIYNSVTYSKECKVEVREVDPESKVVIVNTPGTLGTLLTDDEKENTTNLTLFGKLDGRDVQVLRYMAGRNERGNRTPGTLADLDIYNVEFVDGGNNSFKVNNNNTSYVSAGRLSAYMFYDCVALNSVVLPESVFRIGYDAFNNCANLEKVLIPNNVTSIEGYAFYNCSNLKSFELPASITELGDDVFANCKRLESFSFAEGASIESIPGWTFCNSNLKTIVIPASVTTIGSSAFANNYNLTNVVFENGSKLLEIGNAAFQECNSLQRIDIPEGCLEIGNNCFNDCDNLLSVTIPVSLASIGESAFRYNNSLTDLNIPENSKLSSIGAYAFLNTKLNSFYIPKGLLSIEDIFSSDNNNSIYLPLSFTVHPENKFYESVGGILYSKRSKSAVLIPKTIEGFLSFPDYITNIPDNYLTGCSRIKGVILHTGITGIGESAFSGCAGLQTLMPLSPTPFAVSDTTFYGIDMNFVTLIVPQGSVDAYKNANGWKEFENIVEASDKPIILLSANNVIVYDVSYTSARQTTVSTTVITKDGVTTSTPISWSTGDANIATVVNGVIEFAGEGTTTVTASVTVGEYTSTATCSVTSVGMSSGKMVYVNEAGTLSKLLTDSEKEDLTHLIVMGNLNSDDIRVLRFMAGRDEYGNMTVGSLSVLDMGKARIVYGGEGYYKTDDWWRTVNNDYFNDDVFRSCNSLKKVILPSTLTHIGYCDFYDCANLEEVVLPDGLTYIGSSAFAECRKLSKVNIPSSVTSLSSYVFSGCTSLKTIDLSTMTGINVIPNGMFYETGLTSVCIPVNITNIGSDAFNNTPLKTIEFEKGSRLATIGQYSFRSTQLQSVSIPASVSSIGAYAFSDCQKLAKVTYADNSKLTSIGERVFSNCPIDTFYIPKRLITMGSQEFSESLSEIVVEEGNKFFESIDGVLCSTSDSSLVFVPKSKSIVYLPDYVTNIKSGALQNHNNLKTLVLTPIISNLGESPFSGSYNLSEIYCMNPEPPTVRYLTNGWNGKIFIPSGSKKDYKDANWPEDYLEERAFDYSITLSTSNMKLYNVTGGNTRELSAMLLTPAGPSKNGIEWSSNNQSIATVSSSGVIRYVGEGEAIITAKAVFADTTLTAECQVHNILLDANSDVYYVTAGNLSSLISESRKYEITELVLLGEINADDIRFIREMAGIDNNSNKTDGKLARLNLEAVKVVYGGSYWTDRSGTQYCYDNSLGSYCFADCFTLEEVILPSTLTELSSGMFYECKNLKSATLPSLITRISSSLFYNCKSLTNVYIPENVNNINYNAFGNCTSLKSVITLCSTPPYMDWGAFNGLTISNISLLVPNGTYDAYSKASYWSEFKNITEMDQLPMIFLGYNTLNLYNFNTIGASERTIPATVITKYGITDVNVSWSSSNADVVTVNNGHVAMTTVSGTSVITATATVDGVTLTATCNVTTNVIDAGNAYYVEAGNLPNLISDEEKTTIKKLVLYGELNGTDIRFIREMAGIPEYYWNNSLDGSLEYLDMSNASIVSGGIEYGEAEYIYNDKGDWGGKWARTENDVIGDGMFRKSSSLKTIILPKNIKKIGSYAFYECPRLDEVFNMPSTVTYLSSKALYGFDVIKTTNTDPVELQNSSLLNEGSVVIVPASSLDSYRNADNWIEFKSQIIPDNIQTVISLDVTAENDNSGLLTAAGSDENLSYIMDLTLSGTINGYDIAIIRNRMPILRNLDLTNARIVANPHPYYAESHTENNRLGQDAFRELSKLRRVILPKTIDYVGSSAFYRCENLSSVKMYEGVNTIDNNAFAECEKLIDVELPEGLLSIGGSAFRYCNNLKEIAIPSSVVAIGWSAFEQCYSLKSIVLPKNLSVIEGNTFWYCNNLESVVLPAKAYRIDYYAFYGCSKLKELRLPPMIESIGDRAFYECNNIKDVYVYIANSKDIRIDMNTFSCWTSATLHIPSFSYNSYYWDTQWGQFYSKVEFSDTYDEFYTKNTLELDSQTGTIDGDPDAVLYEQGGLVVDEVEQVLDEVELKSDGTDGASLIASGEGTIKASKLTITINVKAYKWHFFSFPFDLPLDSMKYEGEYVWRQYDGAARSRRAGGWQNLAVGTKALKKGYGYIFQGTKEGSLSFTIEDPDLTAKDEATGLYVHKSNNPEDANWNFVGNPYTAYYNIDETTYSAPITVWTGYGYEAYRPGDDDYQFAPYQAFFVQTPDNTDSINFSADGRESYEEMVTKKAARRAAKRSQTSAGRLFINLEVSRENVEEYEDKTRIVFNNSKSMDYEQDCDAAKFFSETRTIELYSLDPSGVTYSINERPVGDGTVKLGIVVNASGRYTISAVRMDTPVLLIDNKEHATYDLSTGGYSFWAEQGTSDRFTLKLSNPATNVVELRSDAEPEEIYDLQGRKLNDADTEGVIIRNGQKMIGNK